MHFNGEVTKSGLHQRLVSFIFLSSKQTSKNVLSRVQPSSDFHLRLCRYRNIYQTIIDIFPCLCLKKIHLTTLRNDRWLVRFPRRCNFRKPCGSRRTKNGQVRDLIRHRSLKLSLLQQFHLPLSTRFLSASGPDFRGNLHNLCTKRASLKRKRSNSNTSIDIVIVSYRCSFLYRSTGIQSHRRGKNFRAVRKVHRERLEHPIVEFLINDGNVYSLRTSPPDRFYSERSIESGGKLDGVGIRRSFASKRSCLFRGHLVSRMPADSLDFMETSWLFSRGTMAWLKSQQDFAISSYFDRKLVKIAIDECLYIVIFF